MPFLRKSTRIYPGIYFKGILSFMNSFDEYANIIKEPIIKVNDIVFIRPKNVNEITKYNSKDKNNYKTSLLGNINDICKTGNRNLVRLDTNNWNWMSGANPTRENTLDCNFC